LSDSHPLDLLIRKLGTHAVLSDRDRQAILDLPYSRRELEGGTYLVREGDPPSRCGVLISGFAYRQKHTGDGQRQIVGLHIPGEAVDFQNLYLDVSDHSVQMLTRGQVAFVSRADFQALIRDHAGVASAILVNVLVEGSIFREWVVNVGRRDARTRMAHLLCEFAIRMEAQGLAGPEGFELPITQEQLADAVGLTPVHVNRTLKALEAAGLITRNKRSISIPAWDRMREMADFNQRYLHLAPQARCAVPPVH
jgi:CRP-like cAMP-binding protein